MKPVGLWPRLAGAAITGAQYFPVEFGADEAEELCKAERAVSHEMQTLVIPGELVRSTSRGAAAKVGRETRKGAEAPPGETGVACPT